jgi:hypothetical protein
MANPKRARLEVRVARRESRAQAFPPLVVEFPGD